MSTGTLNPPHSLTMTCTTLPEQ